MTVPATQKRIQEDPCLPCSVQHSRDRNWTLCLNESGLLLSARSRTDKWLVCPQLMRTRTEVLLCQLPGHSVQAQCPTEASALEHAQPFSCKHSRSVGIALRHVTRGAVRQWVSCRGERPGVCRKLVGMSVTTAPMQPRRAQGCIARMVPIDYLVNSVLCSHSCCLSKWMQLLIIWGALFLPSREFPLLSDHPWQTLDCMGCLYDWDTRTWVFPFHGSTSCQPL